MESSGSSTCEEFYDCDSISTAGSYHDIYDEDELNAEEIDAEFEKILQENYPNGIPSDIDEEFEDLCHSSKALTELELKDQAYDNEEIEENIAEDTRSALEMIVHLEKMVESLKTLAVQQPTKAQKKAKKESPESKGIELNDGVINNNNGPLKTPVTEVTGNCRVQRSESVKARIAGFEAVSRSASFR